MLHNKKQIKIHYWGKMIISIEQPRDFLLVINRLLWWLFWVVPCSCVYVCWCACWCAKCCWLGCWLALQENVLGALHLRCVVVIFCLYVWLIIVLVLACTHALVDPTYRSCTMAVWCIIRITAHMFILWLHYILLPATLILALHKNILLILRLLRVKRILVCIPIESRRLCQSPFVPIVDHCLLYWHLCEWAWYVRMFVWVMDLHVVYVRVVPQLCWMLASLGSVFAHLDALLMAHVAVVNWVCLSRLPFLELQRLLWWKLVFSINWIWHFQLVHSLT